MRVLFSSTWGYGHVLPMVPLARALVAAGHTVRWAASGDAGQVVTAAGIDAVPAGLDGPETADTRRRIRAVLATSQRVSVAFSLMALSAAWPDEQALRQPAAIAAAAATALVRRVTDRPSGSARCPRNRPR